MCFFFFVRLSFAILPVFAKLFTFCFFFFFVFHFSIFGYASASFHHFCCLISIFFFFSQSRFLWWVVFFCFLGIWAPLLKTPSRLTFDKWPQANLEFYLGDNFCLIGKLFADEFTKSSRMCQFCVHQKREEISRSLFLNRTHLRSTPSFNITIFVYTGSVFWCFCIDMCYRGKKKKSQSWKRISAWLKCSVNLKWSLSMLGV